MREQTDRIDEVWEMSDGSAPQRTDDDDTVELAVLVDAQRSAARAGAAWYAAEFARRDEEEERERAAIPRWEPPALEPAVDASVEDDVVGGAPSGLGLA